MFILTCLKISGIILLLLFGLIVIILSIILFAPFKLCIDGSFLDECLNIKAGVRWLFGTVSAEAEYGKESGASAEIRVFGIKIFDPFEENSKLGIKAKKKSPADKDASASSDCGSIPAKRSSVSISENISDNGKENLKDTESTKECSSDAEIPENNVKAKMHKTQNEESPAGAGAAEKLFLKLKHSYLEARRFLRALYKAVKEKTDVVSNLYGLIKDEKYKSAEEKLFGNIGRLLKELKPTKGGGTFRFGSGEPYSTGTVMEIAAVLYPFYGNWLKIEPYFTESMLEFEIDAKGRIRIFFITVPLIKIYFNKELRELYAKAKIILGI